MYRHSKFGWVWYRSLRPSPSSALQPIHLDKAAPKSISGRTSYRQVCLAFHPYPQLIRHVFNRDRFGPPVSSTSPSSWPWIDHLASGLLHRTLSPCSDSVSLRLQGYYPLTSHNRVTHRLIMQKARSHYIIVAPTACRSIVSGSISLPSRGAFHLSLTVLLHYRWPACI